MFNWKLKIVKWTEQNFNDISSNSAKVLSTILKIFETLNFKNAAGTSSLKESQAFFESKQFLSEYRIP